VNLRQVCRTDDGHPPALANNKLFIGIFEKPFLTITTPSEIFSKSIIPAQVFTVHSSPLKSGEDSATVDLGVE
jgi:hypothetical protein